MKKIRTYQELIHRISFLDRYEYLRMNGKIGRASFGFDRYLNQVLYKTKRWLNTRDIIIIRDNGCDLGMADYPISIPSFEKECQYKEGTIIVHHINPLTVEDIRSGNPDIFNPNYLICTSLRTHNAIHFGDETLLPELPIERRPGDTKLW